MPLRNRVVRPLRNEREPPEATQRRRRQDTDTTRTQYSKGKAPGRVKRWKPAWILLESGARGRNRTFNLL